MGYTHYFELEGKTQFREREVAFINRMLEKSKNILKPEYVVNKNEIHFEGVDSCDDLLIFPKVREFCKTNRLPYDLPVCEVLLILKHLNPTRCKIDSDGFWVGKEECELFQKTGVVKLDENWNQALVNVERALGLKFNWKMDITRPDGRDYYHFILV